MSRDPYKRLAASPAEDHFSPGQTSLAAAVLRAARRLTLGAEGARLPGAVVEESRLARGDVPVPAGLCKAEFICERSF